MTRAWPVLIACLAVAAQASAQPSAPPVLSTTPTPSGAVADPAAMSGLPLQVGDLPPGVLAVRVIRGSFANSLPGQKVELVTPNIAGTAAATTNGEGRAQFNALAVGQTARVRAVVDGELLESQSFQMPSQGGVRLVLVAGVGADVPAAGPAPERVGDGTAPLHDAETLNALLVAVPLAGLAMAGGVWMRRRAVPLAKRRAQAFERLVALERQHRAGRLESERFAVAREALMTELIELDTQMDVVQS